MLLIDKLKEHLKLNRKTIVRQYTGSATYSYNTGAISMIDEMLEWINNLPSKEEIEELILKIEENNATKYYAYNGFSYEELLELKRLLQ